MPKSIIQFQKAPSLHDFLNQYGQEEQCRQPLYRLRWRNGFGCPECGNTTGCAFKSRRLYQRHRCHHQALLTAGRIFHGGKLSLTKWFLAIDLLTQRKKNLAALQLKRDFGINYDTAWKLKYKIMHFMFESQQAKILSGAIELDDSYLSGEKAGKHGRGSSHKDPFVAAVQTRNRNPIKTQLRRVKRFRKTCIQSHAQCAFDSGSIAYRDGLPFIRALELAACHHIPIVTGGARLSPFQITFKGFNIVLGNEKSAIRETIHSISKKYEPLNLAVFEYRFNLRFDLPLMVERWLSACMRTSPMPYRFLKMAEVYG
jgi:hypothetical protein